jgi:hypothetical protein
MKTYKINTYQFEELTDKAKQNVLYWIAKTFDPLEYEKEDGTFGYQYWDDIDDEYVQDTCEANEYVFTYEGTPIHYFINK